MQGTELSTSVVKDNDIGCQSPGNSELDLTGLPSVFVLAAHLTEAELHKAEDTLIDRGAALTYDIREAKLVLGNISKERRAKFELKCGRVKTQDLGKETRSRPLSPNDSIVETSARKRPKFNEGDQSSIKRPTNLDIEDGSSTTDLTNDEIATAPSTRHLVQNLSPSPTIHSSNSTKDEEIPSPTLDSEAFASKIKVVKLSWLHDSIGAGMAQPFGPYTIYEARLISPGEISSSPAEATPQNQSSPSGPSRQIDHDKTKVVQDIVQRAEADANMIKQSNFSRTRRRDRVKEAADQDFQGQSFASSSKTRGRGSRRTISQPPRLVHQTTSEYDEDFSCSTQVILPDWAKENKIYSCQRATPLNSPNKEFIAQLKKIRTARLLIGDEVGVRAYSTSIASIAAYPRTVSSPREILALPGCDQKIAALFHEWHTSGHMQAVSDLEADPVMKVLHVFYEIWGVGASTAREFYYNRQWREMDDIIEHGWQSLTRVQQIGVKFYDEFQLKMARSEVEAIADTISVQARRITDSRLQCIIVGGYRRGKAESSDADIILSHPSESTTKNFISDIVAALEESGQITHTLTLALTNSKRDQQPLPLRSLHGPAGHGFDSLDKALVVWQDPDWPSRVDDLIADPAAKNPNPHRRVDIIVSPWRTIGCAVAGWTSGTTFQRDLRRYAKKVKGWKFDSSGVRERGSGRWIDLEGWGNEETRCTDWREAEKRVFEGLGLVYREPWERCTE